MVAVFYSKEEYTSRHLLNRYEVRGVTSMELDEETNLFVLKYPDEHRSFVPAGRWYLHQISNEENIEETYNANIRRELLRQTWEILPYGTQHYTRWRETLTNEELTLVESWEREFIEAQEREKPPMPEIGKQLSEGMEETREKMRRKFFNSLGEFGIYAEKCTGQHTGGILSSNQSGQSEKPQDPFKDDISDGTKEGE